MKPSEIGYYIQVNLCFTLNLHQGIGVTGYVNKSMLMNNLIPPFMNRNCPTEENSFQEGHDPLGKV